MNLAAGHVLFEKRCWKWRDSSPFKQQVEARSRRLDRGNFEDIYHAMNVLGEDQLWKVLGMTEWTVTTVQDHFGHSQRSLWPV